MNLKRLARRLNRSVRNVVSTSRKTATSRKSAQLSADLNARADGFRDARDWNSAAEAYAHVLQISPKEAPLWVQYGHALKESERMPEAVAAYRHATKLAPDDVDPWLHLAHLLKRLGDPGTREAFETVRELSKDHRILAETHEELQLLKLQAATELERKLEDPLGIQARHPRRSGAPAPSSVTTRRFLGGVHGIRGGRIIVGYARDLAGQGPAKVIFNCAGRQIQGLACHSPAGSNNFDTFQVELPADIAVGTSVEAYFEDGTALPMPAGGAAVANDAPAAGEAFVDAGLDGGIRGWFATPRQGLSGIELMLDGALAGSAYLEHKIIDGSDVVYFHLTPPRIFFDDQTRIAVVKAQTVTGPVELARFLKTFPASATPRVRWERLTFDAQCLVGVLYGPPSPDLSIVLSTPDGPLAYTLATFEEVDLSAGFGRARFSLNLACIDALDLNSDYTLEAPASLALQQLPLASLLAASARAVAITRGQFEITLPIPISGKAVVEVTTLRGETLRQDIQVTRASAVSVLFEFPSDETEPESTSPSTGLVGSRDIVEAIRLFGWAVRQAGPKPEAAVVRAVAPQSLRDPNVLMALRAGGGAFRDDGRTNVCGAWQISGGLIRGWAANLASIDEPLEITVALDNGRSVRIMANTPAIPREAGLTQPMPCGFTVPLIRLLKPGEAAFVSMTFEDGQPFGQRREVNVPSIDASVIETASAIDHALISQGIEHAFLISSTINNRHPQLVMRRLVLEFLLRDEIEDPVSFFAAFEDVVGASDIGRLAGAQRADAAGRIALLPREWVDAFSEEAFAVLRQETADECEAERTARWLCLRQLLGVSQLDLIEALDATALVAVTIDGDANARNDMLVLSSEGRELRLSCAVAWPALAYLSASQQVVSVPEHRSRFEARRLMVGARLEGGPRAARPPLITAEFPVIETSNVQVAPAEAKNIALVDLRGEEPKQWVEVARARLAKIVGSLPADMPVLVLSPDLYYGESYREDALRAFELAGRISVAFAAITWDLHKGALELSFVRSNTTIARVDFAVWRAKDLGDLLSNDLPLIIPDEALPVVTDGVDCRSAHAELTDWIAGGISDASLDRIVQARRHQLVLLNHVAAAEALAAFPTTNLPEALEVAERLIKLGHPQSAYQGVRATLARSSLLSGSVNDEQLATLADLSRRLGLEPEFAVAFCPNALQLARSCPNALTAVGEALAATLDPDALAIALSVMLKGGLTAKRVRSVVRAFELIVRYCSPVAIHAALVQVDDGRPELFSDQIFARVVGTAVVTHDLSRDLRLPSTNLTLDDFVVFADPSELLRSSLRSGKPEAVRQAIARFFASGRTMKEFAALTRTYSVELEAMALSCSDFIDPLRYDDRDYLLAAVLLGDREEQRRLVSRLPTDAAIEAPLYLAAQTRLGDFSGFNRTIARLCHEGGIEPIEFGPGGLATVLGGIVAAERAASPSTAQHGKVLVICSVFNPDLGLMKQVMLSVASQTYTDLEVLVVDDGSDEIDPALIREAALIDSRFRFHRMGRNVGPYECRNWAIQNSDAPFIAINDCDDFAHPQKIERQIGTMTRDPHVRLSTTAHVRLDYHGRPQFEHTLEIFGDGPMTSVFHRSLFNQFGLFASVRSRGDVEFRERVRNWAGAHAIHDDPCPLMYCLATPQSLSNTAASTRGHFLALLRDNFTKRAAVLALATKTAEALPLTVPYPLRSSSASL